MYQLLSILDTLLICTQNYLLWPWRNIRPSPHSPSTTPWPHLQLHRPNTAANPRPTPTEHVCGPLDRRSCSFESFGRPTLTTSWSTSYAVMVKLLSTAITRLSMANNAAAFLPKSSATTIRGRRWVNLQICCVVLGYLFVGASPAVSTLRFVPISVVFCLPKRSF
jgi:hypothetical protein